MRKAGSTLVFTGGGTAGHVLPVEPLIQRFADLGWQNHFIGSKSGLEARLLDSMPVVCHEITCGKLRRYFSLENFVDALRVPVGVIEAWAILRRLRPRLVFSKGGYVSFPVVVAAWLLGIPVIVHESDRSAGLANRMAFPFAQLVCTSFKGSVINARARVEWTGMPLRRSLFEGDAEAGRRFIEAPPSKRVVVVVGGSLGSATLNKAVREVPFELTQRAHVVHVCGAGQVDRSFDHVSGYTQFEYLKASWGDVLAAADLVVSRAGATMLSELMALRMPSVLVPLGRAASRGEQIENARYAEQAGAARVLLEEALTGESLAREVFAMLENLDHWKSRLQDARPPDAAAHIERLILQLASANIS
ncbi:MAG: UDP-N-acetylglucosamine--N-acetylmuramyl-(pentapeptide) pyrophosphoryl-undecaprenol N-acetylglucosamine transferase [Gammaproteobacteria bacterium]|nr:UDP-N-acetylglucosamine--N-acetylmuramyl-(pentapeptide) pyrophosphoryl-undecaprenol N-acetylglucosamine transferase [Gammaproteobacteria bacterium]MCY4276862.1 UDP-N-acetylglucosamine--N-acetylmuramyl-(pentapeptide) pyrophosphoryl-undecaprenol N-acetylglucosamine transferase [Gammaproteobacteria bacterium]MCY4323678.1 UDP-N-acetylglucosamine--N-acetylmuramyl-(pentapeptide) pyrophosphoryl-undecaprenol N-acetylglucosamine transferase [Gammaproteobacteria bacterium]